MMKSEDDLIQQSLKLITQNKVFEQWRSELLFYLSESVIFYFSYFFQFTFTFYLTRTL